MYISKNNYSNNLITSLPPQKVADSQKTEQWGKNCVDALQNMSTQQSKNGRSSKEKKQTWYDLVNSVIDKKQIDYVLNPLGVGNKYGEMPAKMQCYNKIRGDLQALWGEEIQRPFDFMAVGVNGEVITVKEEVKKNAVFQSLIDRLMLELGLTEPQVDQNGQPVEPPTPQQAAKYATRSYKDIREILANQVINALMDGEKLPQKFNKGWQHATIASEELYYVGLVNGEPKLRVVNPLNLDFDKDPDIEFVQDGQWAKEERWLTIGSVIDEYGEYLKDSEIDRLESGEYTNFGVSGAANRPFYDKITENGATVYNSDSLGSWGQNYSSGGDGSHVYVCNVVWKSLQKVGFLKYVDEKGQLQETIVDGDFKLTKEQKAEGWDIEYQWKNQVWQGTKIGDDIYVNIGPLPNQVEGKLPYVGYIYNNLNSEAISLVGLLEPHQYLYNIIWYRMEKEIAKAKGKVLQIDTAKIPRSMGLSFEQVMYYVESMGILVVNSAEETIPGAGPTSATQANNMISTQDLSLSAVMGEYIMVLQQLEQQMSDLSGVTKQRKGATSASETATGVQTAVINSTNTTEPYFFYHNEVKKEVLNQLLKVAQIAYIDGKKLHNVVDEIYTEIIDIDGGLFNDSEFEIRISNSSKDKIIKDKLEQLAQVALQNDKARLSDIVTVIKSSSIAEISAIIREGEQENIQRLQEQQEADRQAQISISENQLTAQRERNAFEAEQNALDRNTKITVAQMTAFAMDGGEDTNLDGQADIVGQMKVALDQNKANNQMLVENAKFQHEQQKLGLEAEKIQIDRQLKEKELEIKKQDSENKVKIATTNRNKFSK